MRISDWSSDVCSSDLATPPTQLETNGGKPASKAELVNFFERLEAELDETGFLFPPEKRPSMLRNLRNMFQRMAPTESEVNTLHGIVVALRDKKGRGRNVGGKKGSGRNRNSGDKRWQERHWSRARARASAGQWRWRWRDRK